MRESAKAIKRADNLRETLFKAFLLFLCVLTPLCMSRPGQAMQPPTRPAIDLTPEERAFLREHPVLTLGIGVAFPPFQFVEKTNGEPRFKGIAADTIHLLAQRLGVRVEPVFGLTFEQALNMGRAGTIDIFPCVGRTPEREEFLAYTAPYLTYPVVIISRDDGPFIGSVEDLHGRKVAEVKALSTYSAFANELPHLDIDFVFEKDTPAMLEAVSLGRAEACVVDLAVASYLINSLGLNNLKVAAPTPWDRNQLAMAVPKDRAILATILQKGLDSLSRDEKTAIQERWIGLKYDSLVSPVLFRHFLLHGGGTAVLVLAILVWRNLGLRREISARKRVEEALTESEKNYRDIFDNAPVGIFQTSSTGRALRVNLAMAEIVGAASAEDAVAKFHDLSTQLYVHPEKRQEFLTVLREHSRVHNFEYEAKPLGGKNAWLRMDARIKEVHPDGSFVIDGFVIDITERKKAEEALVERESQLRALSDNLPNGLVYQIDSGPDGGRREFSFLSGGVETLHGLTAAQAMENATLLYDQIVPEDQPLIASAEALALKRMSPFQAEARVRPPSGETRWRLFRSAPRRLANGHLVWDGLEIDITELVRIREKAEAANKAKSEFIATMSHEIRTPLNAILGVRELLSKTPLDDMQATCVKILHEAGDALMSIIGDILDMAKIESGRYQLFEEPFDVREMVDAVGAIIGPAARRGSLAFRTDVGPDVPDKLVGDARGLRRVLLNLLGNAVKFTPRGSVRLAVERTPGDPRPGALRFTVTDTGIGIPKEKQAAIFDRFVQADASTARRYGGTGLGLPIVERLAKMMGGGVDLTSEPGQGSAFTVTVVLSPALPGHAACPPLLGPTG